MPREQRSPNDRSAFDRFREWTLLLSGLFLFWAALPAFPCTVSRAPPQNFYWLPSRAVGGIFLDPPEAGPPQPTILENCKESVGQYLMISLPIRVPKPSGRTADLFFNPPFRPDPCRVRGGRQSREERLKEMERQYRLVRNCLFIDVVELGGGPLLLPEAQPGGTVERISRSHLRFRGDFLFLQILKNLRVAIGLGLEPGCAAPMAGEASALLNTYIAGDATGLATDLTAIGSSRVRVLLSPPSERPDAEGPAWPPRYRLDTAFGSLEIRLQKNRYRLDFSPFVSRPRDADAAFFLPLSGELVLSELRASGGVESASKIVDSWFFGDTVPPFFEGLLPGLPRWIRADRLRAGSRYRLELLLGNPNEDYRLFRNGLQQILIELRSLFGLPGEDVLEALSGVVSTSGLRSLSPLPDLSGAASPDAIEGALRALTFLDPSGVWPPDYTQTCVGDALRPGESDRALCLPAGRTRRIRHFGVEFRLGSPAESETLPLEEPLLFEEIDSRRREWRPETLPTLDCGIPVSLLSSEVQRGPNGSGYLRMATIVRTLASHHGGNHLDRHLDLLHVARPEFCPQS